MSTIHGEAAMQPPISEYAKHMKTLLPVNIPETYTLKPMFESIAKAENIRSGVAAFRDFLYLFCDRLVSHGDSYAKPQKNTRNPDSYPFLHNINHMLIHIGCHGQLSETGDALLLTPMSAVPKPKVPISKQIEYLRFLALCGFVFTGVDMEAKSLNIAQANLEVSYPAAPKLLTGLKTLAVASRELWVRFHNNADNLLRCDYWAMKADDTDPLEVLKDIIHPLPENLQQFALELHRRYTGMGMTCVILYDNTMHFAYAYTKNSKRALSKRDIYQQRIWEFALSAKYGYCLVVRAKKADKYADIIAKFPPFLQEKIAAGYGCDRKLGLRCQGGCAGIRVPFDGAALEMQRDIEVWLDNELPHSLEK